MRKYLTQVNLVVALGVLVCAAGIHHLVEKGAEREERERLDRIIAEHETRLVELEAELATPGLEEYRAAEIRNEIGVTQIRLYYLRKNRDGIGQCEMATPTPRASV